MRVARLAACSKGREGESALEKQNDVAVAAGRLRDALQNTDRAQLDAATARIATANRALVAYLDAHPHDRPEKAERLAVAADKLVKAVERLRTLLDQRADGELIHQAAIDGLHRYNEFLSAYVGEAPKPEIAIPAELRARMIATVERLTGIVKAHAHECVAMGLALREHLEDDAEVLHAAGEIDDARPQDQREAERAKPGDPYAALVRIEGAILACNRDPSVASFIAFARL